MVLWIEVGKFLLVICPLSASTASNLYRWYSSVRRHSAPSSDTHKFGDAWDSGAVGDSQKRMAASLPEKEVDPKVDAVPLSHPDAQSWYYKDPQVCMLFYLGV